MIIRIGKEEGAENTVHTVTLWSHEAQGSRILANLGSCEYRGVLGAIILTQIYGYSNSHDPSNISTNFAIWIPADTEKKGDPRPRVSREREKEREH